MVAQRVSNKLLSALPGCGCLIILASLLACSSTTTKRGFYTPITAELRQQNYHAAVDSIEAARINNKYSNKDRLLYYLDAGLAHHYARNYDTSNARLTAAEQAADELYTRSISRAAVSVLLNDNTLEYSGEDYEVLYTNLIMAMNYLALNKFDDAFVEIRRANEKLQMLDQKYADAATRYQNEAKKDTADVGITYQADKVRFNNDAFARWLSMHIYAAEGAMDDARIDMTFLERAFREQPHIYDFELPDVKYQSRTGALLSIVALTGLAPLKEVVNLRIRTDKDLNLVQVLYTDSEGKETEYGHLPLPVSADYYFKFSIPKVVAQPSQIDAIVVKIDNSPLGKLQLIEDISNVARETFAARKSLIYLRTIGRAVFKGLAAHKLKKKADTGDLLGWLKKASIDIGMDLTENADLRCSHLLPGKIHVGDFEIKPGQYDLTIEFFDIDGHLVGQKIIPGVQVQNGAFNLVEAMALN